MTSANNLFLSFCPPTIFLRDLRFPIVDVDVKTTYVATTLFAFPSNSNNLRLPSPPPGGLMSFIMPSELLSFRSLHAVCEWQLSAYSGTLLGHFRCQTVFPSIDASYHRSVQSHQSFCHRPIVSSCHTRYSIRHAFPSKRWEQTRLSSYVPVLEITDTYSI